MFGRQKAVGHFKAFHPAAGRGAGKDVFKPFAN